MGRVAVVVVVVVVVDNFFDNFFIPVMRVLLCVVLWCSLCCPGSWAYIWRMSGPMPSYQHRGFRLEPSNRVGMFASASAIPALNTHKPHVRVELDISCPQGLLCANKTFQFVLYQLKMEDRMRHLARVHEIPASPCMSLGQDTGLALPQGRHFTHLWAQRTLRFDPGNYSEYIKNKEIPVSRSIDWTFPVNETALYIASINACSRGDDGTLFRDWDVFFTLEGSVTFMNPWGQIPGQAMGYMPFYFALFVVSTATLPVYGGLCVYHRHNTIKYHHILVALVATTVMESLLHAMFFHDYNTDGNAHGVLFYFAEMMSTARRVLSRVYLLLVAMAGASALASCVAGAGWSLARAPCGWCSAVSTCSTAAPRPRSTR